MKSYSIRQKFLLFTNQYSINELRDGGQLGPLVAFAHQKRFALKEQFKMFTDESMQSVAFAVQARKVMDIHSKFDVTDESGKVIGVIGKDFKSSLLRSTWLVFEAGKEDAPVLTVRERSQGIAIARRLWDFIPLIGEIPFFFPYHFDMTAPGSPEVCGTYAKTTLFRDHYQLDIKGSPAESIDPRVLLSLCIMLDALQSR